jgi:hypothetical protein
MRDLLKEGLIWRIGDGVILVQIWKLKISGYMPPPYIFALQSLRKILEEDV